MHNVKAQRSGQFFVKNMFILQASVCKLDLEVTDWQVINADKHKVKKLFNKNFPKFLTRLELISGNFSPEISELTTIKTILPSNRM